MANDLNQFEESVQQKTEQAEEFSEKFGEFTDKIGETVGSVTSTLTGVLEGQGVFDVATDLATRGVATAGSGAKSAFSKLSQASLTGKQEESQTPLREEIKRKKRLKRKGLISTVNDEDIDNLGQEIRSAITDRPDQSLASVIREREERAVEGPGIVDTAEESSQTSGLFSSLGAGILSLLSAAGGGIAGAVSGITASAFLSSFVVPIAGAFVAGVGGFAFGKFIRRKLQESDAFDFSAFTETIRREIQPLVDLFVGEEKLTISSVISSIDNFISRTAKELRDSFPSVPQFGNELKSIFRKLSSGLKIQANELVGFELFDVKTGNDLLDEANKVLDKQSRQERRQEGNVPGIPPAVRDTPSVLEVPQSNPATVTFAPGDKFAAAQRIEDLKQQVLEVSPTVDPVVESLDVSGVDTVSQSGSEHIDPRENIDDVAEILNEILSELRTENRREQRRIPEQTESLEALLLAKGIIV